MYSDSNGNVTISILICILIGAAKLEARFLKFIARKIGNTAVNKLLTKIGAGVNIGMKNINKIADGLFKTDKDLIGVGIECIASSVPDIIYSLF